jgi:nicotinate-nucleotide adenylyltransferase
LGKTEMETVGIYGGTFDPIHTGHLITAQSVCEIRKLDKIIFIPSLISPHKTDRISSSPRHRINMLKLAIKDIPYFEYSDIEVKRKEISYTINTILALKSAYKNIELIIGYDNLITFDTWKEPDKILEFVKLVVLRRKVREENLHRNKYFNKAIFIETPLIEIFGTDIRERVKTNRSINFLVPQKVMAYIYKHNLYKEK